MIRSLRLIKFLVANTIHEFSTLSPLISEMIYAIPTDSHIYDVFPMIPVFFEVIPEFTIGPCAFPGFFLAILGHSSFLLSDPHRFVKLCCCSKKVIVLKQRYNCNLPVTNDPYNFSSDLSSRFHNPLGGKYYIRGTRNGADKLSKQRKTKICSCVSRSPYI